MAISDILSDLYNSFSLTALHAEAPPEEEKDEGGDDGQEEDSGNDGGDEKEEGGDEGEEDKGDEGGEEGGDEEEEEEEEEEPEDIKPRLEEECSKSQGCAPFKHHFEECAERVRQQEENPDHKGPKEDCVEEFFHLQHCATQCAAPKLFRTLK